MFCHLIGFPRFSFSIFGVYFLLEVSLRVRQICTCLILWQCLLSENPVSGSYCQNYINSLRSSLDNTKAFALRSLYHEDMDPKARMYSLTIGNFNLDSAGEPNLQFYVASTWKQVLVIYNCCMACQNPWNIWASCAASCVEDNCLIKFNENIFTNSRPASLCPVSGYRLVLFFCIYCDCLLFSYPYNLNPPLFLSCICKFIVGMRFFWLYSWLPISYFSIPLFSDLILYRAAILSCNWLSWFCKTNNYAEKLKYGWSLWWIWMVKNLR